jgi:hypothetical protein
MRCRFGTSVGVLSCAAGISGGMNGERKTGAERHHAIELPAVGDPLRAVRVPRRDREMSATHHPIRATTSHEEDYQLHNEFDVANR